MPADRRCVVVGAGLVGLAAASALSRRGWEVRVLDAAGAPGHERAGSKGDARIFRLGYPEPHYVDMAVRARDGWRELERATGRRLLHVTGQVSLGDEATLDGIARALEAAGSPVERIPASAVAARVRGLAATGPVLVEPESGVLAAAECLRALCEAGRVEVLPGKNVTGLREAEGSVAVTSADGAVVHADVVVCCAGPATLGLLGSDTPTAAAPSLPQVAYFAPRRGHDVMPRVFIEWGPDMLYGLPVPGDGPHRGTYKVSHHTPGRVLDAYDPADPTPFAGPDAALLARLTGVVERLLPSLDPHPVATERCVYDNSADTDFVLDRVGRIVVGCGTSGHGFKFGPLLGELLADLAEEARPPVDLARFTLHRGTAPSPGGAPRPG